MKNGRFWLKNGSILAGFWLSYLCNSFVFNANWRFPQGKRISIFEVKRLKTKVLCANSMQSAAHESWLTISKQKTYCENSGEREISLLFSVHFASALE